MVVWLLTRDGLVPVYEALALVSQALQASPALTQQGLGADQVPPEEGRGD